jgi:hypothetical protein
MPAWDQWHLIPIWETYFAGGSIWRMMFQPYAGHLNILPRFVFIGLGLVSHWNIRWQIIASYVVATATLPILLQSLRQTDRRLLVLAAPISAQVFSLLQYENFMTGYPLGAKYLSIRCDGSHLLRYEKRHPDSRRFTYGNSIVHCDFLLGSGAGCMASIHWRSCSHESPREYGLLA